MKKASVCLLASILVCVASPAWADMLKITFTDENSDTSRGRWDNGPDSWSITYVGSGNINIESVLITLVGGEGGPVKFDLAGGVPVYSDGFDFVEVSSSVLYSYDVEDGGTFLQIDFTDGFSSADFLNFTIDVDNSNAAVRGSHMNKSFVTVTYDGGRTATANFSGIYNSFYAEANVPLVVPAPAAAALAFVGLGLVGWVKRRIS